MGKKAKRRGRPPGSKNKKPGKALTKSFVRMEVDQLRGFIGQLESLLATKVQQQREILEAQLEGLKIYANNKAGAAVRSMMRLPKPTRRQKARPKFQSKKDGSLKWSGRGVMPVWMREEMKGTKLTKEDFAIRD